MKVMFLLSLTCLLSLTFAEPPVGDGYPSARSSHDLSYDHDHEHNHSNGFQRSPSQEYGPPAARSPSREYLPPTARRTKLGSNVARTNRLFKERNGISQKYGAPNARTANSRSSLSRTDVPSDTRSGISQDYGVPIARSSAQISPASRGLSTQYGAPKARSEPSQTYSAPATKNGLSQEYAVERTPSAQYGVPEMHMPSEEYGVPSQSPPVTQATEFPEILSARSNNFQQSNPRSSAKSRASTNLRSSKDSSQFRARSVSTNQRVPVARNSYSKKSEGLFNTFGAPNQRSMSNSYEVPRARNSPKNSKAPSSRGNQERNTTMSYTATARSSTSEQYELPEQYSNGTNTGYSYARNGLDELANQEPANYSFTYQVEDYESGSDFGHTETRQDNRAEGSYFVVLPDGTKQVVEYEADERGFKPRISVEPADFARSSGYDDNAADIARSNDGPY